MAFVPVTASAIQTGEQVHYTVIAEDGVSAADAAAAITRAGGTIVSRNDDVGMFSVNATSRFAQAAIDAPELIGATADRAIGQIPDAAVVTRCGRGGGRCRSGRRQRQAVQRQRRRPAQQPAVEHGHGACRRRARESRWATAGSWSASSTAASTRATRTWHRTSTWRCPATSHPTCRTSTDRVRCRAASTRWARTTTATGPTSRASSPRPRTGSASRALPRT